MLDAVFSDPLLSRFVYALILASALPSVVRSGDEALQKTWGWLLVDWVFTSYATEILTAQWAPWVTPAETALVCVPLGDLAKRFRSYPVWSIIGLMVASLALNALAFGEHWQGGLWHNVGANVLFVLRAVVLGGSGAVAYRLRRRAAGPGVRAVS